MPVMRSFRPFTMVYDMRLTLRVSKPFCRDKLLDTEFTITIRGTAVLVQEASPGWLVPQDLFDGNTVWVVFVFMEFVT